MTDLETMTEEEKRGWLELAAAMSAYHEEHACDYECDRLNTFIRNLPARLRVGRAAQEKLEKVVEVLKMVRRDCDESYDEGWYSLKHETNAALVTITDAYDTLAREGS